MKVLQKMLFLNLFNFINTRIMEFKIDTKDTFSIIMPIIDTISAKLTGELRQKCGEMRQSGSKNFIVDLQHCTDNR